MTRVQLLGQKVYIAEFCIQVIVYGTNTQLCSLHFVHTYRYTHTHTHTQILTLNTNIHAHTYKYMHMHTNIHRQTHTHTCKYTLVGRVFANGPGDRVQSQVVSYQRLLKWYLIPPCLILSNIRYVSRVKWSNPGKGVAPSPTPGCGSYWKGSLLVTLDYGRQNNYLLMYLSVTETTSPPTSQFP